MNNFLFSKKPEEAFTTRQLRSIHESLKNVGYRHDFKELYAGLADYCEKYVADVPLTDRKAAPYISDYLLDLLESLTQEGLRSKIFALCGEEKKFRTEMKVPVLYVHRQEAVESVLSAMPFLEPLFRDFPQGAGLIPGFAHPVPVTERTVLLPRPEVSPVSSVTFGTKTLPGRLPEPAKVSILVMAAGLPYEVSLFRDTQGAAIIHTESVRGKGGILTEGNRLLDIRQYAKESGDSIRNGFAGMTAPAPQTFSF